MPMLLAAALLYGLIAALVSDGPGDVVACIFLSVPLAIAARHYYFKNEGKPQSQAVPPGITQAPVAKWVD